MTSLLLALTCSLDAFVASIAYGTNKIKIPFTSVMIINLVCSAFLALSLFFSSIVKRILPENVSTIISFVGLMILGIFYLFQSIVKSYLANSSNIDKKIKLKLFDLRFIIDIYIDETKADLDNSKYLSSKEALYLALALALDSLAVGFAGGLGEVNYKQVVIFSLLIGMIAVFSGLFIGRKLAEKSKVDLSWLSGAILLVLAILRLI